VGGSFFERVPAADAYILRRVIHDWPDAESIAILKAIRAAANPGARVIVIERVVDDAPENAAGKWMDLLMMVVAGGKERTADDFRELFEKAGFELEQIVSMPAPMKLIVARTRG